MAGGIEDFSVRRPAHHKRPFTFKGPARRQPPFNRHRIDFVWPFVLRRESQQPAIWRKSRARFFAWMTGQPLGDAAFGSDPPQVALSRKNDRIAMNGRKSVVTTGRRTATLGGADAAEPKNNCHHRKL